MLRPGPCICEAVLGRARSPEAEERRLRRPLAVSKYLPVVAGRGRAVWGAGAGSRDDVRDWLVLDTHYLHLVYHVFVRIRSQGCLRKKQCMNELF